LRRRIRGKVPFDVFPAIFSSIDRFSKEVLDRFLEEHGRAPPWLDVLGAVKRSEPVPHHSEFKIRHRQSGLTLTGMPDALLRLNDGSLVIIDFKTATFTPGQDALLPLYRVQLNAYGLIASVRKQGPISGLALVYTEPQVSRAAAASGIAGRIDGFVMEFRAGVHRLPYEPASIGPLLAQASSIIQRQSAPVGRVGCRECTKVTQLAMAAGYVQNG
jgi:hypothetical protein